MLFSFAQILTGVGVRISFLPLGLSGVVIMIAGMKPAFLSSSKIITENEDEPKKAKRVLFMFLF
jgi:hypothetical protein